jgi:hypothetical protein
VALVVVGCFASLELLLDTSDEHAEAAKIEKPPTTMMRFVTTTKP